MTKTGYVLLGLGNSEGLKALQWAAREAQTRKAELYLVRAYEWNSHLTPWESGADHTMLQHFREGAEARVRHAARTVHEQYPDVAVRGEAIDDDPRKALLDRAEHACVTVVGSRNLGTFGAATLGSVSTVIAAQAASPVVVVEGVPGQEEENPEVVVGIDDSLLNAQVLEFGFDFASRHGRPLHAIYCWPRDPLADAQWRTPPPPPERADRWLAEAMTGWAEKYPDVTVHHSVVRDRPVSGLLAASLSQELLVVGSHSRHPRVSALLGSVSQGVLHHARCPVAVIR